MWLIYRSTSINKQGYVFPNLSNSKSSGLLLWLEPNHQNPLYNLSLKKRHFPWNWSIPYLFLPSSIVAASLSTLSVPVSISELIFYSTEQQRQLSCVVCWSRAMKKMFSLAGIFKKHLLACTHLLRCKKCIYKWNLLKDVWAVKQKHNWRATSELQVIYNKRQNFREFLCVVFQIKRFKVLVNLLCPFPYKEIGENLNLIFSETILWNPLKFWLTKIFKKHMLDLLASPLD